MCKPSIGGVVKSDLDLEEQYLNLDLNLRIISPHFEGFRLGFGVNMEYTPRILFKNMREVNAHNLPTF